MTDVLVIGGGPAGLCAAIEAATLGASVVVADENPLMGGQLYKQIHKFFGSNEHYAGMRGFDIAKQLIGKAQELGVTLKAHTRALGLLDDGSVALLDLSDHGARQKRVMAKTIVLATGAKENAVAFEGWTLPGVMTAGAAQTFANVHGTLVGKDILIIGSGNVGLIVAYQLMQAGANVVGIAEAAPKVGGYLVHACKIKRAGVPIYLSHTIERAHGTEHVTAADIVTVDERFQPRKGTQKTIACDTVLLATGLSPRVDIASMFGLSIIRECRLGGSMPLHGTAMQTSVPSVFVAGDLAGVEEASTAMDEGRLAGLSAARHCGLQVPEDRFGRLTGSLAGLRSGPHGHVRRQAKEAVVAAFMRTKEA